MEKNFAIGAAKEAGKILMKNYGKMQKLTWKLKTNFKTKVDDLSDSLIRKRITENFPSHNILSEEEKDVDQKSEFSWVIDPLDGTIPYTRGYCPLFSVCIALCKKKTPVLGVIYLPLSQKLYVAEKDKGAFCNNQKIQVSPETNINRVIMGLDSGKETDSFQRTTITPYYQKLLSPNGIACPITVGCASALLCSLASGNLDAYLGISLEPWDMAAGVVICREAGAKVTDTSGKEWQLGNKSLLIANPRLHLTLYKKLAQ